MRSWTRSGGGTGGTGSTGDAVATRPAPAPGLDPGALAGNVINEAARSSVAIVVKPAAAAAVATTFSFPLALMVAVLLFLFVQRCLDARDPKLRAGRRGPGRRLSAFQDEELIVTSTRTVSPAIAVPAASRPSPRPGPRDPSRLHGAQRADGHLLILRFAMARSSSPGRRSAPEAVGIEFEALLAGPSAISPLDGHRESFAARTDRFGHGLLTGLLLVDGLYLAFAMYGTGGTQSPIRFLVYLAPGRRVAAGVVSDRAEDRAVALAAAVRACSTRRPPSSCPPVEVIAGRRHRIRPDAGPQRHLVLAVRASRPRSSRRSTSASCASGARTSSRWSRSAASSTTSRDPLEQARHRARRSRRALRLQARHRPRRLRRPDDRPRDARHRDGPDDREPSPTGSSPGPGSDARSCRSSGSIPTVDPFLAAAMPDARNLLVAPMIADGRPVGAIVVEPPSARRLPGVERRVASMLGQFAARWRRSTCATPCCSGTSRTWPSATR